MKNENKAEGIGAFIPQFPIGIFIIDDDFATVEVLGEVIKTICKKENVTLFTDPELLLKSLHKDVHICIVDYFLNHEMNGLDLIKQVVKLNPYCYFIMLSGQDDKTVVIDFMNSTYGARYVDKADPDEINKVAKYVNEMDDHIHQVKDTYDTLAEVASELKNLKKIMKGDGKTS